MKAFCSLFVCIWVSLFQFIGSAYADCPDLHGTFVCPDYASGKYKGSHEAGLTESKQLATVPDHTFYIYFEHTALEPKSEKRHQFELPTNYSYFIADSLFHKSVIKAAIDTNDKITLPAASCHPEDLRLDLRNEKNLVTYEWTAKGGEDHTRQALIRTEYKRDGKIEKLASRNYCFKVEEISDPKAKKALDKFWYEGELPTDYSSKTGYGPNPRVELKQKCVDGRAPSNAPLLRAPLLPTNKTR
jgi:hypothetical protein